MNISKKILNILLSQESPEDLITLYLLYRYITTYNEKAIKDLKWSSFKIIHIKKQLNKLGLINLKNHNKNYNENYNEIFEKWNNCKVVIHKRLILNMINPIKNALKNYSKEEIFKSFDNYTEVLHSQKYYFKHKWVLKDFLKRGLDKFMDEADPLNNFKLGFSKAATLPLQKKYIDLVEKIIDVNIWNSFTPDKIIISNGLTQIQQWIDNLDFSVYGGSNIKRKIGVLELLIDEYIKFIQVLDWKVRGNIFDVNCKTFKLFISDIESSFSVDLVIRSKNWTK